MTATTHPDVPLPAGAYVVDGWDGQSRLIATEPKEVEGTDTGVSIDACQAPDGSLLSGPGCKRVLVYERLDLYDPSVEHGGTPRWKWGDCLDLTAAGARQLARALIAAADQLDGWEGTDSA